MKRDSFIVGTKLLSIVLAFCLLLPMMNIGVEGQTVYKESLIKETGDTEAFGGGDYIGIRFGTDALFAVVYGTDENPNSPVIFVSMNRYLGKVNVTDTENASYAQGEPVAIRTIYAVRLASLFEFNDTNGDGICNLTRIGTGFGALSLVKNEPILKAVDLNTSWQPGNVKAASNNTEKWKSWEFTITARDLPYITPNATEDTLDMVQFKFSLQAYMRSATYTVPEYNIRITATEGDLSSAEPPEIVNTEATGERTVNGRVLRYRSKVDHVIEGWDLDPTNENPGILLETHSILGNAVSYAMLKWINLQFIQDEDRVGVLEYRTEDGLWTVQEDRTTDAFAVKQPKKLINERLDTNDDWGRYSRFSWVKNVTVTRNGTESVEDMYFQIQGGRRIIWPGDNGIYSGYYVIGGFSYPGGDKIVHDPELSVTNFYQHNAREEESDEGSDMIMPILFFVFVIIMAPIIIMVFKKF